MSPSQPDFLQHMLDECNFILKVAEGKPRDSVLEDETLKRAIMRSLEIIGGGHKKIRR